MTGVRPRERGSRIPLDSRVYVILHVCVCMYTHTSPSLQVHIYVHFNRQRPPVWYFALGSRGPPFCGLVAIVNLALLGPRAGGRLEFVRRVTARREYLPLPTLCQPFLPFLSLSSIAGPDLYTRRGPFGTRSLARSLTHSPPPACLPACYTASV